MYSNLLLPCICGRKPRLVVEGGRCDKHYEVECDCGFSLRSNGKDWSTFYETEIKAIEEWNKRMGSISKN